MFLFLDRDGVINRRLPGDYVRQWEAFAFLPGVLPALRALAGQYRRIFIITNQQGIGKGLMTEADLFSVHQAMLGAIESAGGRIDGIYYCPHLASDRCRCRKPATGMAERARHDFPEVDFARSVMVGDSWSDLQLGQTLGMKNVWVDTKEEDRARIEADWRAGKLIIAARVGGLWEWTLGKIERNNPD